MASIYKRWIPPALIGPLLRMLRKGIYFSGNYSNWELASREADGYDADIILERVKNATLQVASGQAIFERDSVLFNKVEHSFMLLSGLMRAAAEDDGKLSVLDFGGSLGSSYFQCRQFLSVLKEIEWSVVEQPHFVRCGREFIKADGLRFYFEIDDVVQEWSPNVVLLASVLQYLPDPFALLEQIGKTEIPYLIIDRTPFSESSHNVITIQHVAPEIYPASYPCWIFGKQTILNALSERYELVADFEGADTGAEAGGASFAYGGMILRRK